MTNSTAALIAELDASIADLRARRAELAAAVLSGRSDVAELIADYNRLGRLLNHDQLQRDHIIAAA